MMRKNWTFVLVPALLLAFSMLYLLLMGERDAAAVREGVLRFHVVAKSDSAEDQALKIKVRDGVFAMIEQLFSGCTDREEALEVAHDNEQVLKEEAERILRENGNQDPVTLEIGTRFFPTKAYGALSFPAGRYQAVSIRIGAAEGQNFWCVLYPALCEGPAKTEAILQKTGFTPDQIDILTDGESPKYKIKFKILEFFGENFSSNTR